MECNFEKKDGKAKDILEIRKTGDNTKRNK